MSEDWWKVVEGARWRLWDQIVEPVWSHRWGRGYVNTTDNLVNEVQDAR